MDIGIPHALVRADAVGNTLHFNQDFDPGDGGTAQLLIQKVTGFDGAGVRNPTTNRPHKDGALIHAFKRSARVFTVEGEILADSVGTRWAASDYVRGITDSVMGRDATYTINPPGGRPERHLTCRLYDQEDVSGNNYGVAGPKAFAFTFIAGDWRWYTSEVSVVIPNGGDVFVPNNGNTNAWNNFKVRTHGSQVFSLSITQEDTGEAVNWTDDGLPFGLPDPRTGDLNMLDETFYQGNQHNLLGGLSLADSDFFAIPPGGATCSYFSDDFDSDVLVECKSAWV